MEDKVKMLLNGIIAERLDEATQSTITFKVVGGRKSQVHGRATYAPDNTLQGVWFQVREKDETTLVAELQVSENPALLAADAKAKLKVTAPTANFCHRLGRWIAEVEFNQNHLGSYDREVVLEGLLLANALQRNGLHLLFR